MRFDVSLFLALVAAHFLCDYPLQGDFLAKAKNHRAPIAGVPWYQAMVAHCFIQAGAVYVLTRSMPLAILEFLCHFTIDLSKADGEIDFNLDQCLHILCKALWVVFLLRWR